MDNAVMLAIVVWVIAFGAAWYVVVGRLIRARGSRPTEIVCYPRMYFAEVLIGGQWVTLLKGAGEEVLNEALKLRTWFLEEDSPRYDFASRDGRDRADFYLMRDSIQAVKLWFRPGREGDF